MWRLKKLFSRLTKCEFNNKAAKLVVENQRLQLLHGRRSLTDDICMHTAVLVNGQWHSSAEGIWKTTKKKDTLFITIDWKKLPLRQFWQIKKIENGFNWIVYMDIKESIKIEKMLSGIMLCQDYEQWFSGVEEGIFPAFNNSWENIFLQDAKAKLFGVKTITPLPAIVYENLQHGELLLQNTPRRCLSRALRVEINNHGELFTPNRYKSFNSNIYLEEEKDKFLLFLERKNKQIIKTRQLEEGSFKLILGDSSVHIYWKDVQLTINQGFHTALLINDEWFDSSKCDWKIERINDQCIYIDIDWRPLPIRQSWQLNIINEHTFTWKVKTELKEKRADLIAMQTLGLILSAEYEQWFGGYESGYFPYRFDHWRQMVKDKPEGAIGVKSKDKYPALIFKNKDKPQAELMVQNGNEKSAGRFLQSIILKDTGGGTVNNNGFDFLQQVTIVEDAQDIDAHIRKKMDEEIMQQGINSGCLKLIADEGKVRIFWGDKELTTDIGLHTAVRSSGCWYDSGKMKWMVKKITSEKLQVEVDFNPFPVIQIWALYFDKENSICWDILMKIGKSVEIQERKAGIILSAKYKHWFNSFEQGKFPEQFGFWHDIIRNRDRETFGTYPIDDLPGVMFTIDDNHLSLIQNADENVRGRVLQGQIVEADETKVYPKDEFICFKGKLKIATDEKDIRTYKEQTQPLLYETESVYLYGDTAGLHNRIAGVDEFDEKMDKIKELRQKGQAVKTTIGVSRYNFFKLHEIIQFVLGQLGRNIDTRSFKINIFPLKRLRRNFIEYLEELKKITRGLGNIELILVDNQLFEILTAVCTQADTGNERQLLRLLGIICEHAFIGPQIVVIDPFHCCNANCIHCWVHTPGVYHPKEYYDKKLEFEQFKKIADDLSELMVDLIIFQGDGEPLLHERFFDMAKYARSKGLQVSFFTNGILLDKHIADEAVEIGIEEIFCSLPAGCAQTFAKVNTKQKKEVFFKILDNLKYLAQLKTKQKESKPRLIMTHVIHTMNANELVEMAQNDIEISADVMRFYLIRLDENIEFLKLKPKDIQAVRNALTQIKELVKNKEIKLLDTTEFQLGHFEQKTGSWSKDIFLEKGCTLGWNFSLIPASGEVSFCCHLRTVGYLHEKSFKEIWNSSEYQRFRYQAKFLDKNANEKFLNGTLMFDNYCQHCDTHQVIRDVWEQFKLYKLEKFFG